MDNNNNPNNLEGEINKFNENNQNCQECEKENKDLFEAEEQTSQTEEAHTEAKEKASDSKGQADDVNTRQGGFSADYRPPYYVPNFTVYGEGKSEGTKEKPKKTVSLGVVAVICAVSILISATLGALAGAVAGGANVIRFGAGNGKDTVNIIKSDREIEVEEITGSTGHTDLTVAQVAALVGDSVVEITTMNISYGQYITSGAGSGVIFDQENGYGYIVTNYHVISGAENIMVRVKSGSEHADYEAEYVAGDMGEDIAVIRIKTGNSVQLTPAVFVNDSDDLVVGERVVAIGNPLGHLGGTVTDGIISALDREIVVEDNVMTLLQTNAAINPGNSGGGLFNMSGELIGIVNAKQSSTGIEGLGFAIPANVVAKDIKDIINKGYITGRPTLGVTVAYASTFYYGNVVMVTSSSNSLLRKNDIIVKIGNKEISDLATYNAAVKALEIGKTVKVRVLRNGIDLELEIAIRENTSNF